MLNRREFLRGLLATVATGALVKGGIVQPDQMIEVPERKIFDMAANTWRGHHPMDYIVNWNSEVWDAIAKMDNFGITRPVVRYEDFDGNVWHERLPASMNGSVWTFDPAIPIGVRGEYAEVTIRVQAYRQAVLDRAKSAIDSIGQT
jgi:hypothetical protein